jgi:hypothetical protein
MLKGGERNVFLYYNYICNKGKHEGNVKDGSMS